MTSLYSQTLEKKTQVRVMGTQGLLMPWGAKASPSGPIPQKSYCSTNC